METRMALRITRRIWLVIAIIAFTTTMARTESEIPENKVIVDIRPVFLRGYDGMLQCRFNGAPLDVFWLKAPPPEPFPTIDQCPTGADGRGTETCILTQETGADYTELTCRTTGAPRGVVSLSWTLGGTTIPLQEPHRSTNPDGVTEDVTVAINATPSSDTYICVAILPANTRRQATMSVTLNRAPVVTTIEAVTTKNVTVFRPPDYINRHKTVIIISTVCALSVIILIIILLCKIKKGPYKPLKSDPIYDKELCNIVEADDIVSKLVENPTRESEYEFVRSKTDLYSELCECTGDVGTLYPAIEDPKTIKDLRARTDKVGSLDDLEHICWHVQGCKETVKPVLRALYPRNENITKFPGDTQTSGSSRSDVIRDDLQLMKTWQEKQLSKNPEGEGETVKIRTNLVSDRILDKLSRHIPPGTYTTLCTELDIEYNEAKSILLRFNKDVQMATRDCLAQWKTRTGGNMAHLEKILQAAELVDLVKYIK